MMKKPGVKKVRHKDCAHVHQAEIIPAPCVKPCHCAALGHAQPKLSHSLHDTLYLLIDFFSLQQSGTTRTCVLRVASCGHLGGIWWSEPSLQWPLSCKHSQQLKTWFFGCAAGCCHNMLTPKNVPCPKAPARLLTSAWISATAFSVSSHNSAIASARVATYSSSRSTVLHRAGSQLHTAADWTVLQNAIEINLFERLSLRCVTPSRKGTRSPHICTLSSNYASMFQKKSQSSQMSWEIICAYKTFNAQRQRNNFASWPSSDKANHTGIAH